MAGDVGDESQHSATTCQHPRQHVKFRVISKPTGYRAFDGVLIEQRCGQTERPGEQATVEQRGDPGSLARRGRTLPGLRSHHEHPQRGVAYECGDVHPEHPLLKNLSVFRPTRPRPRHRARQHGLRQIFDIGEQRGQFTAPLGGHWRERQRAVSGHHCGDSVLRHRVAPWIPEQRRIQVRVRVDETGSHHSTAGIQLSFPVGREIGPDLDDQAGADPHIRAERGTPGAIHDASASDQQAVRVPLAALHAAQPRSCVIVADSIIEHLLLSCCALAPLRQRGYPHREPHRRDGERSPEPLKKQTSAPPP